MRQFLLGLCAGILGVASLSAQSLRVVTWTAEDFPAPAANAPQNDPELRRLRMAATALKDYNADVIVLEGMPDRNACTKLASMLKPANFTVAQFNVFRGTSNAAVAKSVAVLARKMPFSARTLDWKSTGQIDSSGGFTFANIPAGSNALCLYVAQFVDHAGARTNTRLAQLNAQKRETAAQYLVHHTKWTEGAVTNQLPVFLVLGNLADGPGLWPGDRAAAWLGQAGFRANPLAPASEVAAHAFPQFFARNAEFSGGPQHAAPRGFGTGPVLYELAVKPPAPPVVAAVSTNAAPANALAVATAKPWPVDERFFWLIAPVAGAVIIFLLVLLPWRWMAWRRQSQALVPARKAANAVVVDFATPADEPGALGAGRVPAGQLADGEASPQTSATVREGLMPHLLRLMREKILQKLSSQRAHLIDSHVAGTMQVLELEERLEKIQSQFQARLTAREQRVAELEKELTAKDNFIRELLKAQAKSGQSVNQ